MRPVRIIYCMIAATCGFVRISKNLYAPQGVTTQIWRYIIRLYVYIYIYVTRMLLYYQPGVELEGIYVSIYTVYKSNGIAFLVQMSASLH